MRRRVVRLSQWIPLLITYPERELQDSWGHLLDLSLFGARFQTRAPLKRGQEIFLSFSIGENFFQKIRSRTVRARRDAEGYWLAGAEFLEPPEKKRLKDVLVRLVG
ncbi:MAG: PilZ domain-containing protein [Elusimicrobia bacterium]|nr:PilZ domain-containing protein [Elusimicrobiota bacterium]